jgi:mycothiol synthase
MTEQPPCESRLRGEPISVSDAPPIPGLSFRHFAGPSDYAGIAALRVACALQDGSSEMPTEADVANYFEHPWFTDPYRDTVVAEANGWLAAMQWTTARIIEGVFVAGLRGYLHPAWRRRGLGRALLARGERHARSHVPAEGAVLPGTWQVEASASETGAVALYRACGYLPFRFAYDMTRDLAEPVPSVPLPPGIEIRPACPEHYRAIWEAEREAFEDNPGHAPWPEEGYQRFLNFPHYDPELWRIAWDGDQVAGIVLNFVNAEENAAFDRRRGYTEDIAVRKPWRQRGLASALLADSLRALQERGLSEAALGVDAANPGALALYQRLGFKPVSEWITYRKPWPQDPPWSGSPCAERHPR